MNFLTQQWKAITALFLIFVAGAGAGFFAGSKITYAKVKKAQAETVYKRGVNPLPLEPMKKHLGLSPQQVETIKPIVKKAGGQIRDVHQSAATQINEILDSTHKEISKELNSEQKTKLEEFRKKRQQSFSKRYDGSRKKRIMERFDTNKNGELDPSEREALKESGEFRNRTRAAESQEPPIATP
ncbi:MAG: hypothetical protein SGI71_09815 [Verrucomicrobiota bacterium]|nr:hypothetical protein [Verrucomicrobiota bacterium]